MNQLPIPNTITGEAHSPKLVQFNKNQIYSNGALVMRPALVEVAKYQLSQSGQDYYRANLGSHNPCSSFIDENQVLYTVAGGNLYRYSPVSNTLEFVLNLPRTEFDLNLRIEVTPGFRTYVIGDYLVDLGGINPTASDITIPNGANVGFSQVIRVANRYLFLSDDGLLYFSEVNNINDVDPLSFFDAEAYLDANLMISRLRDDLIVFGERSIERFRGTTSPQIPFQRIQSAMSNIGYVSGLIEIEDTLFFIGRDAFGAKKIYSYSDSGIQVISSGEVEDLIANNLAGMRPEIRGETFIWRGERVLLFKCDEFTLSCTLSSSGISWGFFESDYEPIDGVTVNQQTDSRVPYQNFITLENGATYCHDKYGLYLLTSDTSDVVAANRQATAGISTEEREIDSFFQTFVRDPSESVIRPARVEISIANRELVAQPFPIRSRQGSFNSQTGNIDVATQTIPNESTQALWIQVSKDGINWMPSEKYYYNLDADGRCVFQPLGGFGQFEGYFGMRIGVRDIAQLSIDNITYL